jgi:hypothetical protein
MDRFLRDLEKCLAKLSPDERDEVVRGIRECIEGVTKLGGRVRPSLMGGAGIMREMSFNMAAGRPFRKLVEQAKAKAPKIGPHVSALLQTF